MLVTNSRNLPDIPRRHLFFDEYGIGLGNLQRLRLLTWRRMHELGVRTYKEFSLMSGISELVVRRVFAAKGNKNMGPDLAERWLAALQLDEEDCTEVQAWLTNEARHSVQTLEWPEQATELLFAAVSKHEEAEFNHDPKSAQRLYREAAIELSRVAAITVDNSSYEVRLIRAEALCRLAGIENLIDRSDRAYWHAEEASSLASGIDGDLHLLAKKEAALACQQMGRSYWRKGLDIFRKINQAHRGLVPILGKRFPYQDAGLWVRLTYRSVANILLRCRERTEARDALAEFRRAMCFSGGPMDEFLIKVTEAQLKIKEGRSALALRLLLSLYSGDIPKQTGPRHYQTLLSAMAEAQVMSEGRDPDGRDYVDEALQWARLSGLTQEENELRLRFREHLSISRPSQE